MLLPAFLVITGLFLIPITAALIYFFLGVRSYTLGKKENNRSKVIGGYNSIAYSSLALIVLIFIWYIIVNDLLHIQL
jgi:hypothetical protein